MVEGARRLRFVELLDFQRRVILRSWLSCLPWTLMHARARDPDRMVREALA